MSSKAINTRVSIFVFLLLILFLIYSLIPPVGACGHTDDSDVYGMQTKCTRYLPVDEPEFAEYPAYLERVEDKDAGTVLVRITNNAEGADLGVHHYSKRQSWNSDGSLLMLSNAILDGNTYKLFKKPLQVSSSMNWSNHDPDIVIGIRYDPDPNSLVTWNVVSDQISVLHKFDDYSSCTFGDGEGNVTDDDRLVLLVCTARESADKFLVSYDIANDNILGKLATDPDFNWASFTRSGSYIVVENNVGPMESRALIRYSATLEEPVLLTKNVEHGDLALTSGGDDYYVMLDQKNVLIVNVETKKIRKMPLTLFRSKVGFGHVSCRASVATAGCILSTQGSGVLAYTHIGQSPQYNFLDDGFALLGHHRATSTDYQSTPKASVNRDGTKLIFSSDWSGIHPVEDFVLEVLASQ